MHVPYCILVTYNGSRWLEKCLLSLKHSRISIQVIVVDNGSTDDSLSIVANLLPDAAVFPVQKNLGFGKANNLGIEHALRAGATHVFLLNQDAWIEPDTLPALLSISEANPGLGIISPMHLDGGGIKKDLYFERYLNEAEIRYPLTHPGANIDIQLCCFVNAAAWLITAGCLRKVGGFAPVFYHYGEDVNYCQRARYHGFQIGVVRTSSVCHDRLDRIGGEIHSPSVEKEYIHFLTHVCDISKRNFTKTFFFRLGRHSVYGLAALLTRKKNTSHFHGSLAFKLALAFPSIVRTRRRSKADRDAFLHL